MFSCMKKIFCVQPARPMNKYAYTVTQIPRDGYSPLYLADLPWTEDREDEELEFVDIHSLKMNQDGIYTPYHTVLVPKQTEWVLEKYICDIHNCDMHTVEDIEAQLGFQRNFHYSTKPEWDWLFATMSHVPKFFDRSMDCHTEQIYRQAAKTTDNVMADLGRRMGPTRTRTSQPLLHATSASTPEVGDSDVFKMSAAGLRNKYGGSLPYSLYGAYPQEFIRKCMLQPRYKLGNGAVHVQMEGMHGAASVYKKDIKIKTDNPSVLKRLKRFFRAIS